MRELQAIPEEASIAIEETVAAAVKEIAGTKTTKELHANGYRYWYYFSRKHGYYRAMRPREWIERYVKIRDKSGTIRPLILNRSQRLFYARVLRMVRAKVPVRIIILKARQLGFSTLIQAIFFEQFCRDSQVRALIIAHKKDTSTNLLQMAHTMREWMSRPDGWGERVLGERERYGMRFKWSSAARFQVSLGEPYWNSELITSAETQDPSHGHTFSLLHMSETSRWQNAGQVIKGILNTLPMTPGSMAFSESTANGDSGYFRDTFDEAWRQRDLSMRDSKRTTPWDAMFFPWYQHEEYYWSKTIAPGESLTEEMAREIRDSLDEEEQVLLRQTYLARGEGIRKVNYDQLLWRRMKIQELGGQVDEFHEQYPAFPHEAFLASGRPAYDGKEIRRRMSAASGPLWRGDLCDDAPQELVA